MEIPAMAYPLAFAAVVWASLLAISFLESWRFDRKEAELAEKNQGLRGSNAEMANLYEGIAMWLAEHRPNPEPEGAVTTHVEVRRAPERAGARD